MKNQYKILIALLAPLFTFNLQAECFDSEIAKDHYIVRMKPGAWEKINQNINIMHDTSWKQLNPINKEQALNMLSDSDDLLFQFKGTEKQVQHLDKTYQFESIEQDCWVPVNRIPNDTLFKQQWAHRVTQATSGWDYTMGQHRIVVAISDTGVDYKHNDLRHQMWINFKEQRGRPGVDDDNNGCIDDLFGCDTANNDGDPKPGLTGGSNHGTHVAGIVAARGNNGLGITGVSWRSRIMAVKSFSDYSDFALNSDLINGIYYAVNNGANVINCSWGSNSPASEETKRAFNYALQNGVTVVVAAGNSAMDVRSFSPAGISDLITVGSTNSFDQLSVFSNYGNLVDIVAPGGDFATRHGGYDQKILSTVPGNKYEGLRGTSMAAPYVSGVVALMLSLKPNLSPSAIQSILIKTGNRKYMRVPTRQGLGFSYPRVNVKNALHYVRRMR